MEWISVNDRLPDKTGLYLVHYNYGYMCTIIFYQHTGKWSVDRKDITHWAIPKPPKEANP